MTLKKLKNSQERGEDLVQVTWQVKAKEQSGREEDLVQVTWPKLKKIEQ